MANEKISELNELATAADDDKIPIVDTSAGETKFIQKSNLVTAGAAINSTDGVLPYRSNSTTFADSPISRVSATHIRVPVNVSSAGHLELGSASNSFFWRVRSDNGKLEASGALAFSTGGGQIDGGNVLAAETSVLGFSSGARLKQTQGYVMQFCDNGGSASNGTIALGPRNGSLGASNQNDYDPGTGSAVYRLSSTANVDVTGLARDGNSGEVHYIINVNSSGGNNITLKHESASSTAGKRFLCVGFADIVLAPSERAELWYDTTNSRWRAWKT